MKRLWLLPAGVMLAASVLTAAPAPKNDPAIVTALQAILAKHPTVPSLGGAIVTSHGLEAAGVVGVRKAGAPVPVTIEDDWHLGSDTKAMTAVVVAKLVEQGKLTWDTTIGEVFGDRVASASPVFRQISLVQLFAHRSGLAPNIEWEAAARLPGSPREQRLASLPTIIATPMLSTPGSTYRYSNLGVVVAAMMAEERAHRSWDDMIRDVLFKPLGMHCGFGGLGTPGKIDQPWPHDATGKPEPENGPDVDNPPVMGPAGTVHCSLANWSKFVADQLAGLNGRDGVLHAATYAHMHVVPEVGTYTFGWIVTSRSWGGGTVYTHPGTNLMNYSVVWMAPLRDFAVLTVSNLGGAEAQKATDEAASTLIRIHQTKRLP